MSTENDKQIIESEELESHNDSVNDEPEASERALEETKRKSGGGFFTFLSFVFSVLALAGSAFLYYQGLNQKPQQLPEVQSLEQNFSQLKSETQALIRDLKTLNNNQNKNAQSLSDVNQKLSELNGLKANPNESTNASSELEAQIKQLETLFNQQNNQISSLRSQLSSSDESHKKALQELQTSVPVQPLSQLLPENPEINFSLKRAESHLQMASIYLQVQSNKPLALTEITKAHELIQSNDSQQAQNVAFQLSQTQQLINETKGFETEEALKNLSVLKNQILELTKSSQKKSQEDEKGSWFDNLIVVRKLDSTEDRRLSASETLAFTNQINMHFDLLKLAVFSKNADQWNKNLNELESLVSQSFPQSSTDQVNEIQKLLSVSFDSDFPTLLGIIESLQELSGEK